MAGLVYSVWGQQRHKLFWWSVFQLTRTGTVRSPLVKLLTMADVDTRPTEEKPVATQEKPTDDASIDNATENATTTETGQEQPVTTVFHDRINYNVKHPLHNSWTLWFDNPHKKANAASWSQNLKEIVTVETVEDFWGYGIHIHIYTRRRTIIADPSTLYIAFITTLPKSTISNPTPTITFSRRVFDQSGKILPTQKVANSVSNSPGTVPVRLSTSIGSIW